MHVTVTHVQEALRLVGIEKRERNRLMTNKEREAEEARKMEIWRQQARNTAKKISRFPRDVGMGPPAIHL